MPSTTSRGPDGGDAPSTAPVAPLLKLSPARAVWAVAWPMAALGLVRSAYYLTDSYWVGKLGAKELAALGGAAFGWWMIFNFCDLAGTGAHALVARHEGAGRRDRIAPTITQGLWVGAIAALGLAAIAFPARGLYFELLDFEAGSDESLRGAEYLGACLLGAGTLAAMAVVSAVFRGLGETRTVLGIAALTLVANALLDPLLIWGAGPLPALGIAGAGWATSAANGLGALIGLGLLARRALAPRFAAPAWRVVRTITRIGTPIALGGIGFSLVYVLLGRFINEFGTEHMAALGVGHRLESTGYMVSVGFLIGASTMVGQHLGANNPAGAAACAHAAARICTAFMVPIAILLYLFAPPLFEVFTDDPATAAAGVNYLRIQTLVLVFMGLEVVYEGAFAGAGDTMPPFWIGGVLTAGRIPLAWWLAYQLEWGIGGVWWAIAISTFVKGLLMLFWFLRGRWVNALGTEELGA